MNLCLSPGEFLSSLETCRQKGIGVEDFLCSMKVLAHRNLLAHLDAVLLKGAQLFALMEQSLEAADCQPRPRRRSVPSDEQPQPLEADGCSHSQDPDPEPRPLAGRFGRSDGTLHRDRQATPPPARDPQRERSCEPLPRPRPNQRDASQPSALGTPASPSRTA